MVNIDIAAIISGIAAITASVLAFYQHAKNKHTDYKIDKLKEEREERRKQFNTKATRIYERLWTLLHNLKSARVFIVQPHPLSKQLYISITFEVSRNGYVPIAASLDGEPISNYVKLCAKLAQEDFLFANKISDIEEPDKRFLSLMSNTGAGSVAVKRLTDERYDWTGSIFVCWQNEAGADYDTVKMALENAAITIQYELPEIF